MSRFNQILHQTGERLALPHATRSSILVEIASDLDDLFQHYVNQGLGEEEAARRAEEKVDMSDEALTELVRIHSESRGWTERISRRTQPLWERIAMSMIVLLFVSLVFLGGSKMTLLAHTTGFIWPIGAILILLIGSFAVQLTRSSEELKPRRLREGLATPLFLGGASVTLGFLGAGIEMYRCLMAMAADPDSAGPIFARGALGSTSTLATALVVALLAGLIWFVLAGRATRLEDDVNTRFLEVS